jgi:putative endonuclease
MLRHNSGIEKSTRAGKPWRLIWSTKKESRSEEVILEKKLKNLSRKKLIVFLSIHPEEIVDPQTPT